MTWLDKRVNLTLRINRSDLFGFISLHLFGSFLSYFVSVLRFIALASAICTGHTLAETANGERWREQAEPIQRAICLNICMLSSRMDEGEKEREVGRRARETWVIEENKKINVKYGWMRKGERKRWREGGRYVLTGLSLSRFESPRPLAAAAWQTLARDLFC